jgi:phosphoribosyl 1,2-cyclic phosphodiesterase
VRLATAAKAKMLAIFHHDPDHTDDMLDGIAAEAKTRFSGSIVAAEGLSLRL